MQGHDVGAPDEIVHLVNPLDTVGLGEVRIPIDVVTQNVQAEGAGADGDFLADASQTGDADGLAH